MLDQTPLAKASGAVFGAVSPGKVRHLTVKTVAPTLGSL
jgi:hypothetical protein